MRTAWRAVPTLGLGGEDVGLVVGLRLVEVGLVGLDLGLVLLAGRLGLVHLLVGAGAAGHQVALARLAEPGQLELRLVERELRLGHLPRPRLFAFLRAASASASRVFAWSRATGTAPRRSPAGADPS